MKVTATIRDDSHEATVELPCTPSQLGELLLEAGFEEPTCEYKIMGSDKYTVTLSPTDDLGAELIPHLAGKDLDFANWAVDAVGIVANRRKGNLEKWLRDMVAPVDAPVLREKLKDFLMLDQRHDVLSAALYSLALEPDGGTVTIDFPVKEDNIPHLERLFQVDDLDECSLIEVDSPIKGLAQVDYEESVANVMKMADAVEFQLDKGNLTLLKAFLEAKANTMPVQDLISRIEHLDCYELQPKPTEAVVEYGIYAFEEEYPDISAELKSFIDYQRFGENRLLRNNVAVTSFGWLSPRETELKFYTSAVAADGLGEAYKLIDPKHIPPIHEALENNTFARFGSAGLAKYIPQKDRTEQITALNPDVELKNGQVWGVFKVKAMGWPSAEQMECLKGFLEEVVLDNPLSWNEGIKMLPIPVEGGELHLSFGFDALHQAMGDTLLKMESDFAEEQEDPESSPEITM